MSSLAGPALDAGEILRELLRNIRTSTGYGPEINVSFRGHGKIVGRRDFATHWIHWYPAKMFRRIPSIFLDTLALPPRARILDPFCGSGTVLLEANVRGLDCVGIDINPLARLISRVKTTPIDPNHLNEQLEPVLTKAKLSRAVPTPQPTLDYWLSSKARVGLHRLSVAIEELKDDDWRSFFNIALSNIVRRVSLADPAIPPLVRLKQERVKTAGARYQNALERSNNVTASYVYSTFAESASANIRRMGELYGLRNQLGSAWIGPAESEASESRLKTGSIDTIITSPPYCGSQKYVRSLKLELIITGSKQEEVKQLDLLTLGSEANRGRGAELRDLLSGNDYVDRIICAIFDVNPIRARMASEYSAYLSKFAAECRRVLKPEGHLLVVERH